MLPDGFRISQEDPRSARVLGNLFEHYLHDMAEWFDFDTREDGAYSYPVETCWEDGNAVFFAYAGAIPVGFALVSSAEMWTGDKHGHDLKEFFVVRRYRRSGVGTALARHVWEAHTGSWLVRVYQDNRPALPFWRAAIAAYAGGQWDEEARTVDDKLWSYFRFHR